MNCLKCNQQTTNPKFCGRSCAATYNNKKFPKRKLEQNCIACEGSRSSGRSYCKECWLEETAKRSILKWEACTLAEMKGVGNANAGGRYPYIRTLARKKYLLSNEPKACIVCGYTTHFDIAHVRDIQFFPETALVSEVNDLNNLKALCKNHHWEFDKGYLVIPELGLVKS